MSHYSPKRVLKIKENIRFYRYPDMLGALKLVAVYKRYGTTHRYKL